MKIMRKIVTEKLGTEEVLPCILSLPDMLDFISAYLDIREDAEKTAAELAAVLASRVEGELFKVAFN